jgi:DNA-binding NarL/FixJ family response regulator
MVISVRTAETHVQHIMVKLGFTARSQIAAWAAAARAPRGTRHRGAVVWPEPT